MHKQQNETRVPSYSPTNGVRPRVVQPFISCCSSWTLKSYRFECYDIIEDSKPYHHIKAASFSNCSLLHSFKPMISYIWRCCYLASSSTRSKYIQSLPIMIIHDEKSTNALNLVAICSRWCWVQRYDDWSMHLLLQVHIHLFNQCSVVKVNQCSYWLTFQLCAWCRCCQLRHIIECRVNWRREQHITVNTFV